MESNKNRIKIGFKKDFHDYKNEAIEK